MRRLSCVKRGYYVCRVWAISSGLFTGFPTILRLISVSVLILHSVIMRTKLHNGFSDPILTTLGALGASMVS
jgi:hypothetical protein